MIAFGTAFLLALGSTALVLGAVRGLEGAELSWRRWLVGTGLAAYGAVLWLRPPSLVLSDAGILLGSSAGAFLLGSLLRTRSATATFGMAAALADLASSRIGLTRELVEAFHSGGEGWLLHLALVARVGGRSLAVIGVADLVLAGALFLALWRLGYSAAATVAVLLVAVAGSVLVGWTHGGVPALPFLAVAVTIYVLVRRPGS